MLGQFWLARTLNPLIRRFFWPMCCGNATSLQSIIGSFNVNHERWLTILENWLSTSLNLRIPLSSSGWSNSQVFCFDRNRPDIYDWHEAGTQTSSVLKWPFMVFYRHILKSCPPAVQQPLADWSPFNRRQNIAEANHHGTRWNFWG